MTVQVSVQGRKNCENYCTYAWDRTIGHTPVTNHCSYLHLQYMNSIQGGNNFFVNFSFMCPILTGFLPQRNGGCAVLLPMPVQHTEKLMFFEATNETAVKAFFFFIMINSMGSSIHFHLDAGDLFQPSFSSTTTIPFTHSMWPILCSAWLATAIF